MEIHRFVFTLPLPAEPAEDALPEPAALGPRVLHSVRFKVSVAPEGRAAGLANCNRIVGRAVGKLQDGTPTIRAFDSSGDFHGSGSF